MLTVGSYKFPKKLVPDPIDWLGKGYKQEPGITLYRLEDKIYVIPSFLNANNAYEPIYTLFGAILLDVEDKAILAYDRKNGTSYIDRKRYAETQIKTYKKLYMESKPQQYLGATNKYDINARIESLGSAKWKENVLQLVSDFGYTYLQSIVVDSEVEELAEEYSREQTKMEKEFFAEFASKYSKSYQAEIDEAVETVIRNVQDQDKTPDDIQNL